MIITLAPIYCIVQKRPQQQCGLQIFFDSLFAEKRESKCDEIFESVRENQVRTELNN